MTVYNNHSIHSVFVAAESTRSRAESHNHIISERAEGDERPVAIKCDECEPYLLREGWYKAASTVPLTEDQLERKADLEAQSGIAMRQTVQSLAEAATTRTADARQPEITAEQMAAIKEQLRAELLAEAEAPVFVSKPREGARSLKQPGRAHAAAR